MKTLSILRLQLIVGVMLLAIAATARANESQLQGLPIESSSQGWGTLQIDKSVGGRALCIAGQKFSHGLGTHAYSTIIYALDGEYRNFSAWVGVDEEMKGYAESSVVFQVFGDGRKLFDSGVMRGKDPARRVSVDVSGVEELKLIVTDAGDGASCDHADWAEPVLAGNFVAPAADAKFRIDARDIAIAVDDKGRIIDGSPFAIKGQTRLGGCRPSGVFDMQKTQSGGCAFKRKFVDGKGHSATVLEHFTPEKGFIRWDIQITSPDPSWTTPIITQLQCTKPEEKLIWTAWGAPDFSGKQLTPELAALVQAGKASVSGHWSDPLMSVGFLNRNWHYGNVAQSCPVGSDFIALPLFTILTPAADKGISLVLSPDDVLLNMDLSVSSTGRVQFVRTNHRLGGNTTVKFTLYLVPHEASWRGGLRFLAANYPQYFDPPNPRAHKLAGCGAYSTGELTIDIEKYKKMAFGFNWKLSDDFPYMGMFIPPVKDADEKWERSCDEKSAAYKGRYSSCRQMNDYAKYMKENGFAVLSYFNVTEFGKKMNNHGLRKPVRNADDPELWKDPAGFIKYKLPHAIVDPKIGTCYSAYIVDVGDPDYMKFMLEQAERNTKMLPDTDGICIDRADWLRLYNHNADDGVSWINSKPVRSLFRSWIALMEKMGPQMHKADKVIFSNMMTMRLELCRQLDGIYTEFGNNGNALNASALLGIRKPVVCWTYNETLRQPDPDAFMQRHLYMGCFPTAPYPYNNHCINPEPKADQLYMDYGPLLDTLRGKKWVLEPHCVQSDSAKVNLFQVPSGYVIPVTFGGKNEKATVLVRNIPGLDKLKCRFLHPGSKTAISLAPIFKNGAMELTIPLQRGCAMVSLAKENHD